MKEGRPSRTAQFVALGRALANAGLSHIPDFRDPTARAFLNDRGAKTLAKYENVDLSAKRSVRVEWARAMADMLGLRTVAIDAAVRDAIAGGAKQLVILGAGYDGRAWRMAELKGVPVFEVDHPATQGDKRARVAGLAPPIGDVTFVPVNFESESLIDALERAGHSRTKPTCWIWEGVVMYLRLPAVRATLADIEKSSPSHSTLIVNYHTQHRRTFVARLIFWLIGEPQISSWTPPEMAAELRAHRLVVREDTGMLDWNDRYASGQGRVQRGEYMRIAVAHLR